MLRLYNSLISKTNYKKKPWYRSLKQNKNGLEEPLIYFLKSHVYEYEEVEVVLTLNTL